MLLRAQWSHIWMPLGPSPTHIKNCAKLDACLSGILGINICRLKQLKTYCGSMYLIIISRINLHLWVIFVLTEVLSWHIPCIS